MILITGGLGFIGSNFILHMIQETDHQIINLDKLTYAGNLKNLEVLESNSRYQFIQGDINDSTLVQNLLKKHQPQAIIHFAAESHVDRSIENPSNFVQTNIVGTSTLLNETLKYWQQLPDNEKANFRFLHISTDEVYGSLDPLSPPSTEQSPYAPNSPYAASKAASDHLVRAYHKTYGIPAITTLASNNFGPRQFPEKLIPLAITNALQGKSIPIYGDGMNIRNWIYVEDHCRALKMILEKGIPGERYNIGGESEKTNLELILQICAILDNIKPSLKKISYTTLIKYVKDRPGHDRRYSLDSTKLQSQLGWKVKDDFETNLRKTVGWYL